MEDCRHQTSLIDNIEEYDCDNENIQIAVSDINIDIGGGCFILKKTIMKKPEYYFIYGFDEKYLMSCTNNKKNGVLLDYYVIHPYDLNDDENNRIVY